MRTSNVGVVHAFMLGLAARSGNMKTDGSNLWSYETLIGWTTGRRKHVTSVRFSKTTTRHCNLAVAAGAKPDDA